MSKLQPTLKNVVLELQSKEKEDSLAASDKRIIVPDTVKKQENFATVVAKGEDVNLALPPGTKVVYRVHSGSKVKLDDKEYLIVPEDAILAVVV